MTYRQNIAHMLEAYMEKNIIEYQQIPYENSFYYPMAFKNFAAKSCKKFVTFSMDKKKSVTQADNILLNFLQKNNPDRPIFLILFFEHHIFEHKIYYIVNAYDVYTLIKNQLISDWAITSLDRKYIIFANEGERQYYFSENSYKENFISISITQPHPPHKTIN